MLKVGIYCRLSDEDKNKTDPNADSESISNQKSMLISYADEKGWAIHDIYCDDDYSGIDRTRPGFKKLIEDAESGCFNIVLCKSQSRFTRDLELVEKYINNKFIEWGIRFVGLVDNADTEIKSNKKARQINGLINEWYLEDISENIKAVFDDKRRKGKHIGSFVVYGYDKSPHDKNKVIINDETAHVVKLIFNMYYSGEPISQIVRYLNNNAIPSPSIYQWNRGNKISSNSKSGLWGKDTILKMLKNQMYIGNMVQGYMRKMSYKSEKTVQIPKDDRIIVENTHEAIIDKEKFWEVQKMLSQKRRSSGALGRPYELAGKVKCLDCGSTMVKKTYSKEHEKNYLRCKLSMQIDGKCTCHLIRLDHLYDALTKRIQFHINKYTSVDDISKCIVTTTTYESKVKAKEDENERLSKRIKVLSRALKSLYIEKQEEKIDVLCFESVRKEITEELNQLEKRQKILNDELSNLRNELSSGEGKWRIIEKYMEFCTLDNTVVRELIDFVEIGEKNRDTREQEIVIHWLF